MEASAEKRISESIEGGREARAGTQVAWYWLLRVGLQSIVVVPSESDFLGLNV